MIRFTLAFFLGAMMMIDAVCGEMVTVTSEVRSGNSVITSHGKGVCVEIPGVDCLLVATAWHVVNDGGEIKVKFVDGTHKCPIWKADKEKDIVLLKTPFSNVEKTVGYVPSRDFDADIMHAWNQRGATVEMSVALEKFDSGDSGSPVWRADKLTGIAVSQVVSRGDKAVKNEAVVIPAQYLLKLAARKD